MRKNKKKRFQQTLINRPAATGRAVDNTGNLTSCGGDRRLFIRHPDNGYNHLFEANAPVLESIFVIICKVVVVVGIT